MPQSEPLPFASTWSWRLVGQGELDHLVCIRCGARRSVPSGHRPHACGLCARIERDGLAGATLGPAIDGQAEVLVAGKRPPKVSHG